MPSPLAIYTCIIGKGYSLPPISYRAGAHFLCFTDQRDLGEHSHEWKLIHVNPILPLDLPRSSREYKVRPHRWLINYERSIYIDPSVQLTASPEDAWRFLTVDRESVEIAAMYHSFRESLIDEFRAVISECLDSKETIEEQYLAYYESNPSALSSKPIWGGFLARYHLRSSCVNAMEEWYAHILRYSRRDQLSLPVILSQMPSHCLRLSEGDIHHSSVHSWPIPGYHRPERCYSFTQSTAQDLASDARQSTLSTNSNLSSARPGTIQRGYDEEQSLYFIDDLDFGLRVYVASQSRLKLYHSGVHARIAYLLRDYQIPDSLVGPGDIVVDVGANSGELGIWATLLGARYIGIEPDPLAFHALEKNLSGGELYQVAISDKIGEADFYLATQQADSSLFPPSVYTEKIAIKTRTLDSLLADLQLPCEIKLLKVEAEGMEPEVLSGASSTLREVRFLAVDAGPERGGQNTCPEILNLLLCIGFSVVSCYLPRGTFFLQNSMGPRDEGT